MLISCVCWNIPFPTSKDCTVHPEIRRLELQILGWTIHQLHTVAVQTPKRTSQAKDNQWSEWRSREPHELHVTARTEFPKHIKQQLHITKKHNMYKTCNAFIYYFKTFFRYIVSSFLIFISSVYIIMYIGRIVLWNSLYMFIIMVVPESRSTCTHSPSTPATNATKRQPA